MAAKDISSETLLALFLRLDADRSQTISLNEIVHGMKLLNKTEREIQDLVKGIDEKQEFDLPSFMRLMGMASIDQDAKSTFKEKISQFHIGVVVWHPARGYGIIVDIVPDDERGKPFVVRLVQGSRVFRAWGQQVEG